MGRVRAVVVFGLAVLCVVGGVGLALLGGGSAGENVAYIFAFLVGIFGILWQLYLLASSDSTTTEPDDGWGDEDWDGEDEDSAEDEDDEAEIEFPFEQDDIEDGWSTGEDEDTEVAPERTPREDPLSGMGFTSLFSKGEKRASKADDIEAGFEVIRPKLRATLGNAFLQSGHSRESIEAAFADGSWTDDRIAAAALDEDVPLPTLPLRDRLVAWLFPHRVFREYTRRTVQVVAETSDAALPSVPGQQAPRPIPIRQPPLSELRRGVDGTPHEVADPFDAAGERQTALDVTDGRAVHERLGVLDSEAENDEGVADESADVDADRPDDGDDSEDTTEADTTAESHPEPAPRTAVDGGSES